MIGKVPQTYANARLHEFVIDGWVVETTLTPADVAAMGSKAEGFLRRATEQELAS